MKFTKTNLRIGILIVFLFTAIFLWYAVARAEGGMLSVAFLDVGQGDAIFIESPSGNQMLIDGGASPAVLRELSEHMSFYDRSIDVVVATHPDKDHIGGLPDVLKRYNVDLLLRSGAVNDTGVFRELNTIVESKDIYEALARRGMVIDLGSDAYAEILFPDRDVSRVDPNDASITMRIVYGETEVLLSGDAPQKIENYLVGLDEKNLQSDILKVGHHGSKTSSSEFFLGAVSPKYGVISASRDNSYGHPHAEVLKRFEQFGIPVVSTAEEGTIVFRSNGETFFVK